MGSSQLDVQDREQAQTADVDRAFPALPTGERLTLCTFCGVGDPVRVRDGDQRLKAAGPLGVCVKGAHFVSTNAADAGRTRIEVPQVKRWGRWRTVGWDEVYALIAKRLLKTRRKYGRQSIAYYGVGQLTLEAMWLAKKLFQGFLGTNNVGSNAELCLASSAGGHELVFGNEGSFSCYEDYLDADAIVLYGSNQLINHPTIFDRYFKGNRGATKVVVDPRVTETVKAILAEDPERNLHVRLRSRGDVLLNLAISHALFAGNLTADDYLERHVDPDSLRDFRELVMQPRYAPAEAAKRLAVDRDGVPVLEAQIHKLAELFATGKVATTSSVGINQTSGSEGVASILGLHLLTANLGEPGRGHVRLAGQSNASAELAMGFNCKLLPFRLKVERRRDRVRMAHLWDTHPWSIHPERGVNVTDYPRAEHLRYFFIQGTDFVRNFPDLTAWHDKLRRSFVVVADPFEVPGVREFADVLLPARTHAEIDGVYLNGERRFQALRQVVDPPHDARSDITILVEVAQAVAARLVPMDQQLTDINERYFENRSRGWLAALMPWDNRRRYDDGAPEVAEINHRVRQGNRDIDPRPIKRNFAYPTDGGQVSAAAVWEEVLRASREMYNEFSDDGGPITWERLDTPGGVLWGGQRRYLRGETAKEGGDPGAIFPRRFLHETGRATLVVPDEELREPVAVGGGTFNLITGRGTIGDDDKASARYGVGLFNSGVKAHADGPERHDLFVNPRDAERLGLRPGDSVRITGERGSIDRRIALADEVPPDHLFLSFYPDAARSTPNTIVPSDKYDPYVFQPTIKVLPVTLEKL